MTPPVIPNYLDQIVRESSGSLPIPLPPASFLIEVIKDLQDELDAIKVRLTILEP